MARLKQDKFRIFISHKHADATLANVVAEELEKLDPNLIDCWVSGQDLTAGVDWSRQIKSALHESHLLVLLFTAPARTWDWCLYEVGLFMRFDEDDISSVVCLFDPEGTTPGPLSQVQGVMAEPRSLVNRFLTPLCTETWNVSDEWHKGALVPDPDQRHLGRAARNISKAFESAIASADESSDDGVYCYRPCHNVVLDLEDVDEPETWSGIPFDASVVEGDEDTSSYTLSLFRVHQGRGDRTWGDLVNQVGGEGSGWLTDLDAAFTHSLEEQLWTPSTETLQAWHPGSDETRTYLPMLYEVTRRQPDGQPVRATLVLVPQGNGAAPPKRSETPSWA